jgi:hypothetical protein
MPEIPLSDLDSPVQIYSPKTEALNKYLIQRMSRAGRNLADSTPLNIIGLLTPYRNQTLVSRNTEDWYDDNELINWEASARRLEKGYRRLRRVIMKTWELRDPSDPLLRLAHSYPSGLITYEGEINRQVEQAARDARRQLPRYIFNRLNDFRSFDPDQLCFLLGGYDADLMTGIFGWRPNPGAPLA